MSETTSKIYLDIASLFDLRHSALHHLLGLERSTEIVTSQAYNLREIDHFPEIDPALFAQYLQSSDLRMLEHAPMSYLQVAAASKVANIERRNTFMSETRRPEVVLNLYPFDLTQAQCTLLQNALFIKLGQCSLVTLIKEHPKTLTPHYLKNSGFIACFMYDLHSWLTYHAKAIEAADLREVLMYFAPIYKEQPTKEEIQIFTKLGFKDVFSYTEYLMTGRMQLNFLPVFMYSSLVTATVFLEAHHQALSPDHSHLTQGPLA